MMYSNVLLWLVLISYRLSVSGFISNNRFHVSFHRLKVNTRMHSHISKDQFESKKEVDGINLHAQFTQSNLSIFNNTRTIPVNTLNGSEVRVGIILSREHCYDTVQEIFKVNIII